MDVNAFINGPLRAYEAQNVFNPWRDEDSLMDLEPRTAAQWRRIRLEQHFECSPDLMLIGEAPGYQGCHFSGVPFTNEKLLIDGTIPRIRMNMAITRRHLPYSEPSATVVWGTLHHLGLADRTVMWNAFAWHPHDPLNRLSNRTPTIAELKSGAHVLDAVLDMFKGVRLIAVGTIAAKTLRRLGVTTFESVRHPAYGGATEFRQQLAALCGKAAA